MKFCHLQQHEWKWEPLLSEASQSQEEMLYFLMDGWSLKKNQSSPNVEVPSYSRGGDQEDHGSRPA
jgi:hypothetical protein